MKKRFILPLTLLLILAPFTYAADDIGSVIYDSLGWLTKINLAGGGDQSAFWAKVIVFILVFTLVFWLLGKIGSEESKMKNQIKVPIAVVFGLMTVFVPNAVLQNLMRAYQSVLYIFLFGAVSMIFMVPNLLFSPAKRREHPKLYKFIMGMFAIVVSYVLSQLWESLKLLNVGAQLGTWIRLVVVGSFIYGIVCLIGAIVAGGFGGGMFSSARDIFRRHSDPPNPREVDNPEARTPEDLVNQYYIRGYRNYVHSLHERITKIKEMKDQQRDEGEIENKIRDYEEFMEEYLVRVYNEGRNHIEILTRKAEADPAALPHLERMRRILDTIVNYTIACSDAERRNEQAPAEPDVN